nr:unnamed protein product [Callosobruchus analis]
MYSIQSLLKHTTCPATASFLLEMSNR